MHIKDLLLSSNSYLKITDLENLLNVYYDKDNNLYYNLNETMFLNVNDAYLDSYIVDYDMFWPLISYKLYDTTRLAWLLIKINNVSADKIFDNIKAGLTVKYLKRDYVLSIVSNIQGKK